ncbi:MAG: hypothetical protein ACYT04_45610 [Nostoc sp.]
MFEKWYVVILIELLPPLIPPYKAGLFHSLKGADLQAFQAKNQVTKKSDCARKWRSHLNLLIEVVIFVFPTQANF